MRFRALTVLLMVIASSLMAPASFAKNPVAGASCTKLNSTQIFQGKRFTCIKSGKKLIWNKGVTIKVTPSPTPSLSATATSIPSASPTTFTYTMDQVKANNSSAKCWSVIEGNVYDLTNWINSHPGGAGAIRALCGVDGTQEFNRQHYGQRDPLQRLKLYLLGPLSK